MFDDPAVSVHNVPLGKMEILGLIPHRKPALLVDGAVVLGGLEVPTLQAVYRVTDEDCAGHFPDQPIMPWYVWVESAFQAGGLLVAHLDGRPLEGMAYEVREAKFKRPARPGDQLQLHVVLEQRSRLSATFKVIGYLAGIPAFTGTIKAALGLPGPRPHRTI